jgi:hypothetical protein
MAVLDTYHGFFCYRILPEMVSGGLPLFSSVMTYRSSSGIALIFFHSNLLYFFLKYA